LNVYGVAKPDLGNVTWSQYFLNFFETFCRYAPCNKLCMSTNFISNAPTDQKLWMLEKLRRSLGSAGMCWSQPTRVDHMCKNMWAGGRRKSLGGANKGTHVWLAGHRWSPTRSSGPGAGWQPAVAHRPWPTIWQTTG
jgi:hypothetical protein